MTDSTYTAIAVLMDRSGSMADIRDDAEGALRAFIDDQAKMPGRCTIRLSHFDSEYEDVYLSTPIASAPAYDLIPRGTTALLDGIGRLVVDFGVELAAMPDEQRPGQVIVIIQTDGHENASHDWTRERVFELITSQQARYGWTFIFLGADQDAIEVGGHLGVAAGDSLTWNKSADGVLGAGAALSGKVGRERAGDRSGFTDDERKQARR
jgi:hypothetical protein